MGRLKAGFNPSFPVWNRFRKQFVSTSRATQRCYKGPYSAGKPPWDRLKRLCPVPWSGKTSALLGRVANASRLLIALRCRRLGPWGGTSAASTFHPPASLFESHLPHLPLELGWGGLNLSRPSGIPLVIITQSPAAGGRRPHSVSLPGWIHALRPPSPSVGSCSYSRAPGQPFSSSCTELFHLYSGHEAVARGYGLEPRRRAAELPGPCAGSRALRCRRGGNRLAPGLSRVTPACAQAGAGRSRCSLAGARSRRAGRLRPQAPGYMGAGRGFRGRVCQR